MKLEELYETGNYILLYLKKGNNDAKRWLESINEHGPKETIRDMLLKLNLRNGKIMEKKPWRMMDKKFQLGDYYLFWNNDTVGIAEVETLYDWKADKVDEEEILLEGVRANAHDYTWTKTGKNERAKCNVCLTLRSERDPTYGCNCRPKK